MFRSRCTAPHPIHQRHDCGDSADLQIVKLCRGRLVFVLQGGVEPFDHADASLGTIRGTMPHFSFVWSLLTANMTVDDTSFTL
jgi:hypothetical protein